MGAYVGEHVIRLLAGHDLPIRQARVAILGFAFKENVPDIRNSKVIDIFLKLKSFGIEPMVHDPLADPAAMQDEYGISLSGLDALHSMNAITLAVPHAAYDAIGVDRLCDMVADGGIFVDIKSKFGPERLRPDLTYWSL